MGNCNQELNFAEAFRRDLADLTGAYASAYDHGTERLLLKPDGRFEQSFETEAGPEEQFPGGTWSFDTSTGVLGLDGYVAITDGYCRAVEHRDRGRAVLDPERSYLIWVRSGWVRAKAAR